MINAAEALHIILDHTSLLSTEKVSLLASLGRSIGQRVLAKEDIPRFDNSSMDGYAVASSDLRSATVEHPCTLTIVGESSAGDPFGGVVESGQAVRVLTGGMMPAGADAVVPIEHATEFDGQHVQLTKAINSGQCVRIQGEDIKNGEAALRMGQTLKPGAIGVLAAMGYQRVRVYKRPRVNIIATGDELVDIGEEPGPGEIRNSSSYALAADVASTGGVPRICDIVPDKPKRLRRKIEDALHTDVLLVTGGVSVGKYDFVKDILEELGVQISFWKVNIKPGMPLVFGKRKKTLVFGLPGNPVSTSVTFLQFVRPALLKMCGQEEVLPAKYNAVLDQEYRKADGKRHFARGVIERRDGVLYVVTTGNQSSGAISSLSKANCLIIIPEEATLLRKGDQIEIELL